MEDYEDRLREAERYDASPQKLAKLAGDSSATVRRQVAMHGLTPAAALEVLAKDPDVSIRCTVAQHKRLPCRALIEMSHDLALGVREEVAMSIQVRANELARVLGRKELGDWWKESDPLVRGALRHVLSKRSDGASIAQEGRD